MPYNPQDDVTPLPAGTAMEIITRPTNYIVRSDMGQRGQIWIVLAILAGLVVVGSLMLATSSPTPAQAEQIAALNTPRPITGTPSPTVTATVTPYYTPTMNAVEQAELAFVVTKNAATHAALNVQMTADSGKAARWGNAPS